MRDVMTVDAVIEVRWLVDGLRWDRRRDPFYGRREYSAEPSPLILAAWRRSG
jgi:hypothetical protein